MAALQGMHVPGYAAILFRRTFADLRLPGALMDRAGQWLASSGWHWSAIDHRWTTPEGATLSFGYLDHPTDIYRYQSTEFQFIGFDETSQFSQSDYLYLFSRLRQRRDIMLPPRMRGATNPGGIGHRWLQQRFGIPATGSRVPITQQIRNTLGDGSVVESERTYIPALLADNPGIDARAYRLALAQLDPVTRSQLEDGVWTLDTSGLVYQYSETDHAVSALPELRRGEEWSHVIGVDYGMRDSTAFVVLAWCQTLPTTYIVHAEHHTGMLARDSAEVLRSLWDRYDPIGAVGDGGGLGGPYVAEAQRIYGLPIELAEKSAKRGTQALFAGALADGTLRAVLPGAAPWAEEAGALLWEDDRRLREHQGQPNHCCDAALYAWRKARHYHPDRYVPPPDYDPHEEEAERRYSEHASLMRNIGLRRMV